MGWGGGGLPACAQPKPAVASVRDAIVSMRFVCFTLFSLFFSFWIELKTQEYIRFELMERGWLCVQIVPRLMDPDPERGTSKPE